MDETLWHKCTMLIIPPKLITGERARHGQLWRRRNAAGAWEYQQDPETDEAFAARQW